MSDLPQSLLDPVRQVLISGPPPPPPEPAAAEAKPAAKPNPKPKAAPKPKVAQEPEVEPEPEEEWRTTTVMFDRATDDYLERLDAAQKLIRRRSGISQAAVVRYALRRLAETQTDAEVLRNLPTRRR